MITLLDLPSELITRIPFGIQFLLHDARLHDAQWVTDRATIAALSRTCSRLHTIFNPVLYRSLILTSLSTAHRLQLVRTLILRPDIALHVEDLKLDLFSQRFPLRDVVVVERQEEAESPSSSPSDGDWYRFLSHLVYPNMRNLKQLAIRCTRLEKTLCDFVELNFAHIQCYCQGRGIGLEAGGVEQLLLAPKMQKLILSGPYISDARELTKLGTASSNASSLSLRLVMVSVDTLQTVLRVARNLDSFEFYSSSMRAPFLEAKTRDSFLTFEQINDTLQQQKDNLSSIRICYPSSDAELPTSVFGGLSFHNFSRLTRLSMAAEMYLGWKQCIHSNPNTDRLFGPPDRVTFANCLPHCLEELTIFIQQYQRPRNGNDYAYDVIRGVLQQRKRLYKLDTIELTCCKWTVACQQCRVAALTYLDQSPTVGRDELVRIKQMCDAADVRFKWSEGFWEEN